jgi:transposase-like protein
VPTDRSAKWPVEVKAAAVSALLAGQTLQEVGRTFGVPAPTLHGWKEAARKLVLNDGSPDTSFAYEWAPPFESDMRVAFSSYLAEAFHALRVQMALFSHPEYLARQPIDAVVAAHGVVADRVARIAEGIGQLESMAAPAPRIQPPAIEERISFEKIVPEPVPKKPSGGQRKVSTKLRHFPMGRESYNASNKSSKLAANAVGVQPDRAPGIIEGIGGPEDASYDEVPGACQPGLADIPE